MKNVFLFLFGFAFWQMGFSQITIDGSNFIVPGTTLNYENANPIWLSNQSVMTTSGENVVWDLSDWQSAGNVEENYGAVDTLSLVNQLYFNNEFLNPGSFSTVVLPVAGNLIDLPIPLDISDGYSFFRKDDTGYYGTGTSFSFSGFPIATPNDEVERIYKFPMHFGDTDTTSLAYFISLPTLGAYGQNATRYSQVDGMGILNTPYGTYDVLRVKAIRHITDTLYIEQVGTGQTIERPEQIDYAWLSPNVAGPVLKMTVINGAAVSAQLLNDSIATGISEKPMPDFVIYPNPTNQFITIQSNEKPTGVKIFTVSGGLVLSQKHNLRTIDIQNLSPGMYFVQVAFSRKENSLQKLRITQ